MLQDPDYVSAMAQAGFSVPTYAYALNSPLSFTDPSGRAVRLEDQLAIAYFDRFTKEDPGAAEALIASPLIFTFSVDAVTAETLNGNPVQGYKYPWNAVVVYKNINNMRACGSTHDGDLVFAHEVGHLLSQNHIWHGIVRESGRCEERQADLYARSVTGQRIEPLDMKYWADGYPECGMLP